MAKFDDNNLEFMVNTNVWPKPFRVLLKDVEMEAYDYIGRHYMRNHHHKEEATVTEHHDDDHYYNGGLREGDRQLLADIKLWGTIPEIFQGFYATRLTNESDAKTIDWIENSNKQYVKNNNALSERARGSARAHLEKIQTRARLLGLSPLVSTGS